MEWIEKLKPGDLVIVAQGGICGNDALRRVDRIGKLYVTVDKERFHKHSGYAPGHGYFIPRLKEATPERVSELKRLSTADSLKATDWRSLPLETLKAVAALVAESKGDGR